MGKAILGLLGLGLVLNSTGCFAVNDQGPVMSLELYWDEEPDGSKFIGGDCEGAGVDTMDWTLFSIDGKRKTKATSRREPCADGIDIIDPKPGQYRLEIVGEDAKGKSLWKDSCDVLWVTRFDVSYDCDITAP
jgi:hypothetical protein